MVTPGDDNSNKMIKLCHMHHLLGTSGLRRTITSSSSPEKAVGSGGHKSVASGGKRMAQ